LLLLIVITRHRKRRIRRAWRIRVFIAKCRRYPALALPLGKTNIIDCDVTAKFKNDQCQLTPSSILELKSVFCAETKGLGDLGPKTKKKSDVTSKQSTVTDLLSRPKSGRIGGFVSSCGLGRALAEPVLESIVLENPISKQQAGTVERSRFWL
jgi:hypothetical protein